MTIYFIGLTLLEPPLVQIGLGNGRARMARMVHGPAPWISSLLGTTPGDGTMLAELKKRFQPCMRPDGWYVGTAEPLATFLKTITPPIAGDAPSAAATIPITQPTPLTSSALKEWRVTYKMNQPQAAILLGVPVTTYRQWEQDRVRPHPLLYRATQAINLLYPKEAPGGEN